MPSPAYAGCRAPPRRPSDVGDGLSGAAVAVADWTAGRVVVRRPLGLIVTGALPDASDFGPAMAAWPSTSLLYISSGRRPGASGSCWSCWRSCGPTLAGRAVFSPPSQFFSPSSVPLAMPGVPCASGVPTPGGRAGSPPAARNRAPGAGRRRVQREGSAAKRSFPVSVVVCALPRRAARGRRRRRPRRSRAAGSVAWVCRGGLQRKGSATWRSSRRFGGTRRRPACCPLR